MPPPDRSDADEAAAIARKCVHCGFCLATCPTYQLLGNELDSPRGRIYLIKEAMQGGKVTGRTLQHLDRCLTCRACETTCPSGVEYGRLLDIGRVQVERRVARSIPDAISRRLLRIVLTQRHVFAAGVRLAQWVSPLLPVALRRRIPQRRTALPWPPPRHPRKMLLLEGCVQPALDPGIDAAAATVLDRMGISLIRVRGCCGAIAQHLSAREAALRQMRRNLDAWWPWVEAGVEAVVVTASGCGPTMREYGHLLRDDPTYADRAATVTALVRDIGEIVAANWKALAGRMGRISGAGSMRVAFQSPCSLQHGLRLDGVVQGILRDAGLQLLEVEDAHLCCGSAGTYSILQAQLSGCLLERKVAALQRHRPDVIATANIGCLIHLRSAARVPVVHWIELLAQRLEK